MRLRAPDVERRLRKAARRIINASPRLKREYRKHRVPPLLGLLQSMPSVHSSTILIAPAVFLGIAAGKGVAECEAGLAVASVVAGLASTLVAMSVVGPLRCSRDLAVFSMVPIDDRAAAGYHQQQTIRAGAFLLPPMVIFYGSVVLAWQMPGGRIALVLWLGLLELAVILGFGLVLSGLLLGRIERVGCFVLLIAAVCGIAVAVVYFLGLQVPVPWQSLASALNMLLPTGWPHAVLQYGVIEQERAAWLLLVPVAVLFGCIPGSVARIGRVYRVREIMLAGDGTATAVLPPEWYGVKVDAESDDVWIAPIAPEETPDAWLPRDRNALRRYVRASAFLAGWDWGGIGGRFSVERLLRPLLSRREREITEFLLPRPPLWSRRILPLTFLAAALGVVTWSHPLFGFPAAPDAVIVCLLPLVFVTVVAISAPVRDGWASASGELAVPIAVVPIGHREAARAAMVVGVLRGLAILPAAAVAGISSFAGAGLGVWQGALTGLRCAVVFVAIHYWSYWAFTRRRTSVPTGFAPLARQGVYGTLLVSFIVAAFVSVQPELGEPWNTLLAGVMFTCGWMASRFDEWRFNRGGYDLTARPVGE